MGTVAVRSEIRWRPENLLSTLLSDVGSLQPKQSIENAQAWRAWAWSTSLDQGRIKGEYRPRTPLPAANRDGVETTDDLRAGQERPRDHAMRMALQC